MGSRHRTRPPSWAIQIALIILLLVVGALDAYSDPLLAFSSFYVLPIALSSWVGPRGWGMALAATGAIVWTWTQFPYLPAGISPFVWIWNSVMRLSTLMAVAWLVGMLRVQLALARQQSRIDTLTGLATRGWFLDRLETEVERSKRYGRPLTVAYIDVDGFKPVNDTHGHQAGDQLLQRIAETLREQSRDIDLAARLGGDEFMLLLPETGGDRAAKTIRRLHAALQEASQAIGSPVTFSVGVLTFERSPDDPGGIVGQVDELMYEAKRAGKDRVVHRVAR